MPCIGRQAFTTYIGASRSTAFHRMAINFHPKPGALLMCEFGPHPNDVQPPGVMRGPLCTIPEIHKYRPVVVMAAPAIQGAIVVPLSTSTPEKPKNYHYFIPGGSYGSLPTDSWVLTHLVQMVSCARLERCRVNGRFTMEYLRTVDYQAVRACLKDHVFHL